ncbi:MAG: hypothetical protein ACRDKJ_03990 [Actinomycetota bacterium]
MRRLRVPVVAVSMTVGGLAYAAGDGSPSDTIGRSAGEGSPVRELDTGDTLLDTDPKTSADDDGGDPTGSSGVTSTGRSTEGCPQGFDGNHGQYVSGTEDHPRRDAAHSPCGKPLHAVEDDDVDAEGDDGPGPKKGHHNEKPKGKP